MSRTRYRPGDPRGVEPLIRTLEDRVEWMRQSAAGALGAIGGKIDDRRTAQRVARRVWWRLTDVASVAEVAWVALAPVVARLTELEVATLEDEPSLFNPA